MAMMVAPPYGTRSIPQPYGAVAGATFGGGVCRPGGILKPREFKFVARPQESTSGAAQISPDVASSHERPRGTVSDVACAGPPVRTPSYEVGTQVEVWSKSEQSWCPGKIEELEAGMAYVSFITPSSLAGTKDLPIGHPELRLPSCKKHEPAGQQERRPPRNESFPPPEPPRPGMSFQSHGCPPQAIIPRESFARKDLLVLPAGWETAVDQDSGDTYYFNRATGVVSWDHPASPNPEFHQSPGVLVDAQEDVVDPATGRKRVAPLSMQAVHSQNPWQSLSIREHGMETCGKTGHFDFNPEASQLANFIVQQAICMAAVVAQEPQDVFDSQWRGPRGSDPLIALFNAPAFEGVSRSLESLALEVQQILASQPTLVEAPVPVKVYGDIHGQFRDLLLMLHHYGFPQRQQGPAFIFNGDWADRGKHQLEVISLLFALKAVFPNKVWLVRGNHEDAIQNESMGHAGFHRHCLERLNPRVFGAVHQAFNWLPLACLVSNKILVVHGGIGDGQWSLEHLRAMRRPLDHDALARDRVVYNILWSDPIPDDQGSAQATFGVHDSPRDGHQHLMLTFGRDVTEHFCKRNHLEMIVRSHQALVRGFGYDVMHGGRCVRVFSARDYEGSGNDGAILSITEGAGHLLVRAQVVRSLAVPKMDG